MPPDDHNGAAIHLRADGRYVAAYAKHWGDRRIRYRVSERRTTPPPGARTKSGAARR